MRLKLQSIEKKSASQTSNMALEKSQINTRRTSKFDPRNILHWNPEENIGNISLKSYVNATPDLFSYLPDQRVIDGLMEFLKPHEPQIDIRNDCRENPQLP
ncbi:hypothetical protein PGT21_034023 [Puccinia graminis f. sp. tritici]|uniref:Uncharacterized protein n=1 Tax=Puccinia graminis f. sp. tritici TaxID=56615 RepID=A0A5B0R445_PUCGR|nr:hypothetical protein PGT21_034023 [Puccinia graminis f. sp. tritici]